jgi:hypothetical protein
MADIVSTRHLIASQHITSVLTGLFKGRPLKP